MSIKDNKETKLEGLIKKFAIIGSFACLTSFGYWIILIMTSNHYDKLDPALVRPGRIDVKLEMSCLSKESVMQIFEHLYGKLVPRKHISSIPDKKLTPAKLMNIYINNQQSETQFLRELIK